MKILVTGAKGFVGRNLCENLKNLRDGKNLYPPRPDRGRDLRIRHRYRPGLAGGILRQGELCL